MADDIETIRKVGLQRAYALIRGLEAYRGFARLIPIRLNIDTCPVSMPD